MMSPHPTTANLHAARNYSMTEIGKASAIMGIAIVGLVFALSYPVAATGAIVGLVGGLVASRVWSTGGIRPHRKVLATVNSQVGRRHDRSV